jgi:hypothetical protein
MMCPMMEMGPIGMGLMGLMMFLSWAVLIALGVVGIWALIRYLQNNPPIRKA